MSLGDLLSQSIAISSLASDLILVSPLEQLGIVPQDANGIQSPSRETLNNGFVFHIVGDESVNVSSDITDHYTETNSAVQDHISIRPITVTVSGYIGELNNVIPKELSLIKLGVDKLTVLQAYLPSLTATAQRAFNIAQQAYAAFEKAKLAIKRATNTETYPSKQAEAFSKLYKMYKNRTLFIIQTPYCLFGNMAIQSMTATQQDGNKNVSDFEITFKQIRFVNTKVTSKLRSPKMKLGEAVKKAPTATQVQT